MPLRRFRGYCFANGISKKGFVGPLDRTDAPLTRVGVFFGFRVARRVREAA